MSANRRIKPSSGKALTQVRCSGGLKNLNQEEIRFSFKYFHPESTRIGDFNNECESYAASLKIHDGFLRILKDLSGHSIDELLNGRVKHALHFNLLNSGETTERITDVLQNSYHFPAELIEQFEGLYFEFFAGANGARVIAIRVDNVLCPLFTDCNHLVCKNSSREFSKKQNYNVPLDLAYREGEESTFPDPIYVDMLFQMAERGEITDVAALVKGYKSLLSTVS